MSQTHEPSARRRSALLAQPGRINPGLFLATLIIFGAAAARAEDAGEGPASARPVADGQLALPRAHLFGDWRGARTSLQDHGITPTVTFVTDALGNPSGGRQKDFNAANNLG